jgi:hypothetical protein
MRELPHRSRASTLVEARRASTLLIEIGTVRRDDGEGRVRNLRVPSKRNRRESLLESEEMKLYLLNPNGGEKLAIQ